MSDVVPHLQSSGVEVRCDDATRAAYSADASNYRRVPVGVVTPRSVEDVVTAVQVCAEHAVPITPRGGGTSIAGNAVGPGVVLDLSRHLNRVRLLDPDAQVADVEAGAILSHVNAHARPHQLVVGPDPSSAPRCTIGGMLGNNACGAHAVAWGTTADITLGLDVVTATGEVLTVTGPRDGAPGSTGSATLDQHLRDIVAAHLAPLRTELGRFSRQMSGYHLHHLLPERGFDAPRAVVGSEGTWAILTGARLQLQRRPAATALLVGGFPTVYDAADAAPAAAPAGALTAEGMDGPLVAAAHRRGPHPGARHLPPGEGWLLCEVPGLTPAAAVEAARAVATSLGLVIGSTARILVDPNAVRDTWALRRDGAGLGSRLPDGTPTYQGWEDAAVPPEHLGAYLRGLHTLLRERGRSGTITGHFGEGCIHQRIDWPLDTAADVADFRDFILHAHQLVLDYGGSASGEHGDGRARSELLAATYSADALTAFAAAKQAWDPSGLLNPGVIVDPEPLAAHLRVGPSKGDAEPSALAHAFPHDAGSFTRAVHRCVGVGSCRAVPVGPTREGQPVGPCGTTVTLPGDAPAASERHAAMCPTYQASGEETLSTRGRARILGELLRGEAFTDWSEPSVAAAIESCLGCRACANHCPSGVDVASLKVEYLAHRRALAPVPRGDALLAALPDRVRALYRSQAVASVASWLVRYGSRVPGVSALTLWAAGLEPRRKAPLLHPRRSVVPPVGEGVPLRLFLDTFSGYLHGQVGEAAGRVLAAAGYAVEQVGAGECCGLTWYSTGDVAEARRRWTSLRDRLPADNSSVVVLEPSCAEFIATAGTLLGIDGPTPSVTSLAAAVIQAPTWPFGPVADDELVRQVHCHQQAGAGGDADTELWRRLGVTTQVTPVGCCGLAGNFGFQPGHWELAQAVAERELYPALRRGGYPEAVADGFSCRQQVRDGGFPDALHTAEALARLLLPQPTPLQADDTGMTTRA